SPPRIVPHADELGRAAEILNSGKKVAILVGQGALGAGDEVLEVADTLGAGVAKALLGRAVVPDDVPYVTGSIGLLGTRPRWQLMEKRAHEDADPINPQRVFWELSSRLPDDCILTSDSGSAANWFARDLKLRRGMMASLSGTLATMGPGVPYAIAAKFAYPGRVAIALIGDGAFQTNGISELITIAKYWERWADPRLVVLVLHNNDLNQVTWEQRAME